MTAGQRTLRNRFYRCMYRIFLKIKGVNDIENEKEGIMKNALASGWMSPRQTTNLQCFRGCWPKE